MRTAVRSFQIRPIIDAAELCDIVDRTLAATGEHADSVSFVFVDDARMSDYHGRYVDVPEPTDVLSFPAEAMMPDDERDLGDVVICTDQAARQARRAGRPYLNELRILALHGLLHLLGFDHERDSGEMVGVERRLRPAIIGGGHS